MKKSIIRILCIVLAVAVMQPVVFAANAETEGGEIYLYGRSHDGRQHSGHGGRNDLNGYGGSDSASSSRYRSSNDNWKENYKSFENVNKWSEDEFSAAVALGLVPEIFATLPMNEPITRREFCYAAMLLYEAFAGSASNITIDVSFTDCMDSRVSAAYKLGIVSGYDDQSFGPDNHISRQEIFKMLSNLLASLNSEPVVSDKFAESALRQYSDSASVGKWAVGPACVMLSTEVTRGVDSGRLDPLGSATREQAVVMAYRVFKALTRGEFRDLVLEDYSASRLGYMDRASEWKARQGERERANAEYEAKYIRIFGSLDAPLYKSDAEASPNMVSVQVPVWNYNTAGEKVSTTRWLTVHKNIADTVKLIFQEIYEGSEKFPIYSVGGYSWRSSGTSEHNWGIAIDINPNENYMIKRDGTIVAGSFWKPGENKYSIPENGDVVRAFAKYGFAWGGNAWQSSNDYMHFSYFGN